MNHSMELDRDKKGLSGKDLGHGALRDTSFNIPQITPDTYSKPLQSEWSARSMNTSSISLETERGEDQVSHRITAQNLYSDAEE